VALTGPAAADASALPVALPAALDSAALDAAAVVELELELVELLLHAVSTNATAPMPMTVAVNFLAGL